MSVTDAPTADLARPLTRMDVLSTADVADLLNMPKSTVEDWARRGLLPSHKRGRRRFYLRWEITEWLTSDSEP
jgi:excisionase family DNA binding protein